MKLEKIELLVEKIDHAINVIQKFKDINSSQEKQIEKLSKENEKIKEENKKLKEENKKQKDEINKTNDLHQRLEDKIQQILQYLPDDDSIEVKENDKNLQEKSIEEDNKKNKEQENKIEEEKDEYRLEKLVNEPEQFEKKSLFSHEEKNDPEKSDEENELNYDTSGDKIIEEEVVDIDIKQNEEDEEVNKDFEVNFDDTLLDEEDGNIEFDFDDNPGGNNKDLPKGVL